MGQDKAVLRTWLHHVTRIALRPLWLMVCTMHVQGSLAFRPLTVAAPIRCHRAHQLPSLIRLYPQLYLPPLFKASRPLTVDIQYEPNKCYETALWPRAQHPQGRSTEKHGTRDGASWRQGSGHVTDLYDLDAPGLWSRARGAAEQQSNRARVSYVYIGTLLP